MAVMNSISENHKLQVINYNYLPADYSENGDTSSSIIDFKTRAEGTDYSSSKSYTRLSSQQPVAAVVVKYDQDDHRTVEALSDYGVTHFNASDGSIKDGAPVLNRYGWGTGIFTYSPALNGRFTIYNYEKQLGAGETPTANNAQQVYSGDSENSDQDKRWRQYARESHGGDWYGYGNFWSIWDFDINGSGKVEQDSHLQTDGITPLNSLYQYRFSFSNRWADTYDLSGFRESKKVDYIDFYLPITGLNYSDINEGYKGAYEAHSNRDYKNWVNPKYNNYLLSGIQLDKEVGAKGSVAPLISIGHEAVPFKYVSSENNSIDFNWNIKSAKYLINYWDQIGYYGYDQTAGAYLPTQYIALSDFDNPMYVPNTKLIDAFDSNNSPITKTVAWKNNLVIFTSTSTSLAVGRVPTTKELVHSDVGVPEFYRDTVQVVSDSIVFKNEESVFAFVPTPGTDGATSLRVRNIAAQIKPYLIKLEKEHKDEFELSSVTLHNGAYWLIYSFKDSHKTIIFKYDWATFSWTVDEYETDFIDIIKIDNDNVVGVREDGNLFKFLSEDGVDYFTYISKAWHDFLSNPKDEANVEFTNWLLVNDPSELIAKSEKFKTGTLQDVPGTEMDVIFNRDKLTNITTPEFNITSKLLASQIYGFIEYPISYALHTGPRSTSTDDKTFFEEVSVGYGSEVTTPIEDQKLKVFTDGFLNNTFNLKVDGKTRAIGFDNAQEKWSFGSSKYEKPALTKATRKVLKPAQTIDIHLEGETANRLNIDSVTIGYRQTGRKNFTR